MLECIKKKQSPWENDDKNCLTGHNPMRIFMFNPL